MAITTDPTYPVAGDEVTLAITGATGTAVATQFELTSLPDISELDTGMLEDADGETVQTFTPDVAGAYGVTAYDYRRFSGVGAYPGDPAGEARDLLVATQTGTIYVAEVVELPIRAGIHQVTLWWVVHNATVVEASLEDPTTEKARQAILDATVAAAVAALEGQAASSIGESLITDVDAFLTAFNAHLDNTTPHNTEDTANQLNPAKINSAPGAGHVLNLLRDRYVLHATTGGETWHNEYDMTNLPIALSANDLAGQFVLLCDMRRVWAAHIADADVHDAADAGAAMPAASLLTTAVMAVLSFFANLSPSTPTGENPAATTAVSRYGFEVVSE